MSDQELPDPFDLSDEEFAAQEGAFASQDVEADESADEDTVIYEERGGDDESVIEGLDEETDTDETSDEADPSDDDEADSGSGDSDDSGDDDDDPADDTGDSDVDDDDTDDTEESDEEDSDADESVAEKEFYNRITAPFKANGKEMQVDNPDDVVRLMQMGANYNRKMASMKPHLKTLKMLEKNGLTEEKLNFLIDIDKKNPAAIAQLLKSAEIDPQDLLDDDREYKASDYKVDDRELALDEVVEELRDTETYTKTLDVISNKWDDTSRKYVAQEPQLMKVINDHMASGVYDIINTAVERERTLGRLNGMSDLEAYRSVGDQIHAQGGFNHLFQPEQSGTKTPKKQSTPKQKTVDPKRQAKRRAASPTKAAADNASPADFNPLGLSDDEFIKQVDDRFL